MPVDSWWKAEACAAEVLQQQKITKLPINPFQIADAKDIKHQENPSLESGISGCLMRVGNNFGIMYSSRYPSTGFRRFTVGHELGHYFLEGHAEHLFKDGCDDTFLLLVSSPRIVMNRRRMPSQLVC